SAGNVGRFLALPLTPGWHEVDVEFTGVRWANALSLVGWVGVITVPFIRRRQKHREGQATGERSGRATGSRFNPFDAAVAVGALLLGVVAIKGYPKLARYFDGSPRTPTTADRHLHGAHLPACRAPRRRSPRRPRGPQGQGDRLDCPARREPHADRPRAQAGRPPRHRA